MTTPRVEVNGVWKKFRRGELHDSLRDLIPAIVRGFGKGTARCSLEDDDFWALKDVSFRVEPGEALGIIGQNGAGKSTILKLLSRILRPTRGHCCVTGRVGALIEIAAGFHGDLTGRENVFLQGAIMGMSREEIRQRFDDIVQFSGVEEFIDTPVKRYSSGMNARLGFSIAAHMNPEVLLIDEVLSVGDFSFQRRAFERMREMVAGDIPVVIVSHQLERIASLCTKALVLERGQIVSRGNPVDCITDYVSRESIPLQSSSSDCPISLSSISTQGVRTLGSGERLTLRIAGEVDASWQKDLPGVGVRVRALQSGQVMFATGSKACGLKLPKNGALSLEVSLQMNVAPGIYSIETYVWNPITRSEWLIGPRTNVKIRETVRFVGPSQLNPKMQFLNPGSPVLGPKV